MILNFVQSGLDKTSLFGSHITSNKNFIFVSGNGHNIFNGMVNVFNKSPIIENNEIKLTIHSNIYVPEILNSDFGLKTSATDNMLAINAIAYDIYQGCVFIFKYLNDRWIYVKKIMLRENTNYLNGFGNNIFFHNEKLYVSTFFNEIYQCDILLKNVYLKKIKSSDNNEINFNTKISNDIKGNIFVSNLTNIIMFSNLENSILSYYTEQLFQNDCFFGSNLFVNQNKLYVSCSLYYPFYDNDLSLFDNFNSKIYIYKIFYNSDDTINFLDLENILFDTHNDVFFGTTVYENENFLAIAGNECVYYYYKQNFTEKIIIPKSTHNYDYTLHITDNILIVGNYMHNNLEGALFVGQFSDMTNEISNTLNKSKNTIGLKLVFLIGVICFAIMALFGIMLIFYNCVLCLSPVPLKKKKKDEPYSPYKVYSYKGYIETDDVPVIWPSNVETNYVPVVWFSNVNYVSNMDQSIPNNNDHYLKEISKKKSNIESKELVVSYNGYVDEKIKINKNNLYL